MTTLAALKALLSGDKANFIAASQEKAGQMEQAQKQTLPFKSREPRSDWEALGFVFGNNIDNLFIEATFPPGWTKRPTDHQMHTEILDAKGRVRGSIFYKAAFYDQRADCNLKCRFYVSTDYNEDQRTVFIHDECGQVDKKLPPLKAPDWNGDREEAMESNAAIDAARESLLQWLNETYPGWNSPLAYWD